MCHDVSKDCLALLLGLSLYPYWKYDGYLSESIERAKQHFEEINLSFTAACLLFNRGWVGEVWLVPFHLPGNFVTDVDYLVTSSLPGPSSRRRDHRVQATRLNGRVNLVSRCLLSRDLVGWCPVGQQSIKATNLQMLRIGTYRVFFSSSLVPP